MESATEPPKEEDIFYSDEEDWDEDEDWDSEEEGCCPQVPLPACGMGHSSLPTSTTEECLNNEIIKFMRKKKGKERLKS